MHDWLHKPTDLSSSLPLLNKYAGLIESPVLKHLSRSERLPETKTVKGMVKDFLRKVYDDQGPKKTPLNNDSPEASASLPALNAQASETVHQLELEAKHLYGELDLLRGRLTEVQYDGDERREFPDRYKARAIARRVMELDRAIKRRYNDMDFVREHGKSPEDLVKSNWEKILYWLDVRYRYQDYINKEKSYHKKHGRYRNEETIKYREGVIAEIKEFIQKYG